MGPVKRLRLRVSERRKRIIAVAIELFSSHSYDDIGIDDIAKQAGMSKGLLYHYFATKRDLYLDMMRQVMEEFQQETQVDESIPRSERMHANLHSLFAFIERRPSLYISLFFGGIGTDAEARAIVDQFVNTTTFRILQDYAINSDLPLWSLAVHGWINLVMDVLGQWVVAPQREQINKETIMELLESSFYTMLPPAKA